MDASTIAENAANRDGGGLYNNPLGRRQGVTKLQDNLIADNAGGSLVARSVPIKSLGFNLIAAPVVGDFSPEPTDIITTEDPLLAPLDFYVGGGTKVHALLPGSPAIDAGVAIKGLAFDQRFAPPSRRGRPGHRLVRVGRLHRGDRRQRPGRRGRHPLRLPP